MIVGAGYLLAYVGTIWVANWMIATFGVVSVGFGLMAPAGVYAAGLALTLRDMTQDRLGKGAVLAAIAVGAALSALVSPQFALASGVAFGLSELADMVVYTPLKERGRWLLAMAASNTVGLAVDSALFLMLAFGSLDFLPGQLAGKLWITAATMVALWMWRRRDLAFGRRPA